MALNQSHVRRGPEVEHHNGWDIPEGELVVQPEVPVNGDVANQVDIIAVCPVESWQIEERCHYQPGRINTQQAVLVELPQSWILYPREPKADTTQEQEHIYTHITTSS